MLDVNHPHGHSSNTKLDFSYFLNPPPIYEELPELDDRDNNGPSEDEFAEDELSVIDVPINQCHSGSHESSGGCGGGNGDPNLPSTSTANRSHYLHNSMSRGTRPRVQSLNRKRNSSRNTSAGTGTTGGFKSQR